MDDNFQTYSKGKTFGLLTYFCTRCLSISVLTAIFPGGAGLAGTRMSPFWSLLELRIMEVVSGDNWRYKMCKTPIKMSPPTNHHPDFYRPDALPVAQPTMSERRNGIRPVKIRSD